MKYIITGSLGNISQPIVKQLIAAGHSVTVVSSNPSKKQEIEHLGATAAIGSVEDRSFLVNTFAGADAAYLMIPPNFVTDDNGAFQKRVADNYVAAVKENNIGHVVQLSSIGAHLRKGAGPIDGLAYLEDQLEVLKNVNVKMLRPSYFFYNLLSMAGMLKHAGIMGSNFGSSNEKLVLVSPSDIAEVAAKTLLDLDFKGHSIQYISSDERHPNEIAAVLSNAVNKPANWITFSNEDALGGMLQAGLKPTMAEGYVQMGKSINEGILQEDYRKHVTAPAGKVKLEDFAKDFAAIYAQS